MAIYVSVYQFRLYFNSEGITHDFYKFNICLNPIEHQRHHIDPNNDTDFCILTGWANPFLNFMNKKFKLTKSSSYYIRFFDYLLN